MSETVRFGFVGVGGVAGLMASLARESARVDVVACVARTPTGGEQFAREYGVSRVHRDLDSLMADDEVDAVYIATPNARHAEQALAAIHAGKHVLVEKPMALTATEARELAHAAEHANRLLGVGFHLRHHDVFKEMKRRLDAGAVGEPRLVRATWGVVGRGTRAAWKDDRKLAGAGALMGFGVHLLDLVPWLLTDEPTKVTAMSDASDGRLDTTVLAILSFAECLADLQVSGSQALPNVLVVHGTEGELRAEQALTHLAEGRLCSADGELLVAATQNPFQAELEAFAEAIRAGKTFHADGWEGLRSVELATRVIEADRERPEAA